MVNTFKLYVAAMIVLASSSAILIAQEKPSKEVTVEKEGKKPSKETPKEQSGSAKKEAEKPSKEPPTKEKPDAVKKPAKEQPAEKKPDGQKAKAAAKEFTPTEAMVKSVHPEKNAFTVVLRKDGEKVEQTFTVDKDARFLIGGNKSASLGDVKPETRVMLMLTEQKTVAGIKTFDAKDGGKKGQIGNGVVEAVDTSKGVVTIKGEGGDQTFVISKDVKGDPISDLKPGTRVAYLLSEDKKTVTAIKAVAESEKAPAKKKEAK